MISLRNFSSARIALAAACTFAFATCAEAEAPTLTFHAVENAPKGMTLPFSEAVQAGDMIYLAGQVGVDATGKLAAGGIKGEPSK